MQVLEIIEMGEKSVFHGDPFTFIVSLGISQKLLVNFFLYCYVRDFNEWTLLSS